MAALQRGLGNTTASSSSQWTGVYDCSVCRRKRLTGSEFSKKALERHRKDKNAPLKCKTCVAAAEKAEQERAAAKTAAAAATAAGGGADGGGADGGGGGSVEGELHTCAACGVAKPAATFNKNQLRNKGPGKQRCMPCVTAASEAEAAATTEAQQVRRLGSCLEHHLPPSSLPLPLSLLLSDRNGVMIGTYYI